MPYHSSFDETIAFSDTDCQLVLTAGGVGQTYTIPGKVGQKNKVSFSYNATANVYVGLNTAVSIPSSGTHTSAAFVEYRPTERFASGGDVLSFVTPDATVYMGISVRATSK